MAGEKRFGLHYLGLRNWCKFIYWKDFKGIWWETEGKGQWNNRFENQCREL